MADKDNSKGGVELKSAVVSISVPGFRGKCGELFFDDNGRADNVTADQLKTLKKDFPPLPVTIIEQ
jgi:hypothetical protein